MTDDLFPVPHSTLPPLEAARRRLKDAEEAFAKADADETGRLKRDVKDATAALMKLERDIYLRE